MGELAGESEGKQAKREQASFFPVLEKEVKSFGFTVSISEKEKTQQSTIRSAFLKANTKEHLLMFYPDEKRAGTVPRTELIKIKFEVDVNPPRYASFERKYRLRPSPMKFSFMMYRPFLRGKFMLSSADHGRTV